MLKNYVQYIIDLVNQESGMYTKDWLVEALINYAENCGSDLKLSNALSHIKKAENRDDGIILRHAKSVVPGIYLGKRYFSKRC